jgi:hypothetical protein
MKLQLNVQSGSMRQIYVKLLIFQLVGKSFVLSFKLRIKEL